MALNPDYSLAGLFVGFIVGLTGVGGGSLMTPILIFLLGVPPTKAVGTDLLFAAITKSAGTLVHNGRGNVEWRITGRLLVGSIPGTLLALTVFSQVQTVHDGLNAIILPLLGATLVGTAAAVGLRKKILRFAGEHDGADSAPHWTTVFGVVIGILVTFTSVGAGAIGAAGLMLLYPRLRSPKIVGSDLAHAIPLTLVAGLGHLKLGNVDYALLASLLVGSIPGIYAGSTITTRLPEPLMRGILISALLVAGVACIV